MRRKTLQLGLGFGDLFHVLGSGGRLALRPLAKHQFVRVVGEKVRRQGRIALFQGHPMFIPCRYLVVLNLGQILCNVERAVWKFPDPVSSRFLGLRVPGSRLRVTGWDPLEWARLRETSGLKCGEIAGRS